MIKVGDVPQNVTEREQSFPIRWLPSVAWLSLSSSQLSPFYNIHSKAIPCHSNSIQFQINIVRRYIFIYIYIDTYVYICIVAPRLNDKYKRSDKDKTIENVVVCVRILSLFETWYFEESDFYTQFS